MYCKEVIEAVPQTCRIEMGHGEYPNRKHYLMLKASWLYLPRVCKYLCVLWISSHLPWLKLEQENKAIEDALLLPSGYLKLKHANRIRKEEGVGPLLEAAEIAEFYIKTFNSAEAKELLGKRWMHKNTVIYQCLHLPMLTCLTLQNYRKAPLKEQ